MHTSPHSSAAPARKLPSSPIKISISHFDSLPASGLVDVRTVAALLGYSNNTVWRKVSTPGFPKPIKIGPNTTRWNVGEVRRYLAGLTKSAA